jgi:predicted ester cyclase
MSAEQNKAIVRRFFEGFEANNEAAMKAVLSPDLVAYTHGGPGPQTREEMLQGIRMWNDTFSDTHFEILEQIAEGDTVATYMVFHSTHSKAEFQGLPPTGKQIEMEGVTLERIKDGKIVERRVISDWLVAMQQLGLIPQAG